MSTPTKVTTIVCPTCSVWVEIYPGAVPDYFGSYYRDAEMCKTPPLKDCPAIRAEIDEQFPGHFAQAAK
jgi:hypothetical protein